MSTKLNHTKGHGVTTRRLTAVACAALMAGGAFIVGQSGVAGSSAAPPTAGAALHCTPSSKLPTQATPSDPTVTVKAPSVPQYIADLYGVPAPPNARMTIHVYLKLRDQKGAEALAKAVSDPNPNNPDRGKYITPEQFAQCFAASPAQAQTVQNYEGGFEKLEFSGGPSNKSYLTFTGTVAQIQNAFGTAIYIFQFSDGSLGFLPVGDPHIPNTLEPYVQTIGGLDGSIGTANGIHSVTNRPTKVLEMPVVNSNDPPAAPATLNKKHLIASLHHAQGAHNNIADPGPAAVKPSAGPPPVYVNDNANCSTFFGENTAKNEPGAFGTASTPPVKQPWVVCGYTPSQITKAYGVDKLHAQHITGKGVIVAVVDAFASPTIVGDINTYAARNGEKPYVSGQFTNSTDASVFDVSDNGNPCNPSGWYGEETLDVEAVHAMAPDSRIVYQSAASCQDMDLQAAENNLVDSRAADIVTNSWGQTGENDPAIAQPYENTFIQAATQGMTITFSSGDNGDGRSSARYITPDYPATSPYVTAVGGTSIAIDKNGNRMWEEAWGTIRQDLTGGGTGWDPNSAQQVYGAGGGTSAVYKQPWYQTGKIPSQFGTGAFDWVTGGPVLGRSVADVAMAADPNTGMKIGETQTWPDGTTKYGEYRIGGTSWASPLFAGEQALANQEAGHPLGFANPAIYDMYNSKDGAFLDIASSPPAHAVVRNDFTNKTDASGGETTTLRWIGYDWTLEAAPGYDQPTGVGVPTPNYVKDAGHALG